MIETAIGPVGVGINPLLSTRPFTDQLMDPILNNDEVKISYQSSVPVGSVFEIPCEEQTKTKEVPIWCVTLFFPYGDSWMDESSLSSVTLCAAPKNGLTANLVRHPGPLG
ncbi:hypothetical protein BCY86_04080 [Pajaroellobacter abortibovis]|uniref:Uncharacterized protein n=1 Tax=Pajaroellobacter abortibovis TaxID=1882918 RepID=A0A1L6MWL9_9BACT|nr:hypothetical protein BCY86_04080 [Pajaroellobacter abortibovis]